MKPANEMIETSNKYEDLLLKEELEIIEKGMNVAAFSGQHKLVINDNITVLAKKSLKEAGYIVEQLNNDNGDITFTIRW